MLKAEALSYGSSFFYNFSLSMISIIIPLYALELKYSPFLIGLLISAPGILQIGLRLFGGLISDQFGEKRVLWLSFGIMCVGLLIFIVSGSFISLFVGQLVMGASRSLYWTPSQSYASRIDASNVQQILGRLSSFVNAGQVLGLSFAGFFIYALGYKKTFVTCIILATICLLLSLAMPNLINRKVATKKFKEILSPLPSMFKRPILYFAGILAFVAALQQSLLASFYPVYFREIGHSETMVGILTAIRPIGSIIIGLIFALVLNKVGQKRLFRWGVAGTGLFIFLTPFLKSSWSLILLMLIIGFTTGSAYIYHQVVASEHSSSEERGTFLSAAGLFWSFGILVIPALFGTLANYFGLAPTFMGVGLSLITISFLSDLLFNSLVYTQKQEERVVATKLE